MFTMKKYDPISGDTLEWNLDFTSIAYMCSILTGSDIIAAVTLIKFDDQPKLFSIILGEGLFNDVVVIILYQTMKKISEDPNTTNEDNLYKTPFIAIYDFILLTIISLLIGLFCGFIATYMTKRMRFLSHSAVAESALLLGWAMLGYLFSEMI